jgi:hypothetical protein
VREIDVGPCLGRHLHFAAIPFAAISSMVDAATVTVNQEHPLPAAARLQTTAYLELDQSIPTGYDEQQGGEISPCNNERLRVTRYPSFCP